MLGADDDFFSGLAGPDRATGGDWYDVLMGGFGSDRLNGSAGADSFFHIGIADHGSDCLQEFTEVDTLVFGQAGSFTAEDALVQLDHTSGAGMPPCAKPS